MELLQTPESQQQEPRFSTRQQQGFSIIEVIISMAIFALITTGLVFRHMQFNNSIQIGNLAYDVALSIRSAQAYGLSVRQYAPGTPEFDLGYGVHFDQANPSQYILFVDRAPQNRKYDGGTETVETFTLQKGYTVANFCGTLSGGTEKCRGTISYLDIVFDRPNPDAFILSSITSDLYASARIVMRSPAGTERTVRVANTGQISIETPTP